MKQYSVERIYHGLAVVEAADPIEAILQTAHCQTPVNWLVEMPIEHYWRLLSADREVWKVEDAAAELVAYYTTRPALASIGGAA